MQSLTVAERLSLDECEAEITQALDMIRASWRRVGAALGRIHAERLYRSWCDTFDEYVEARWQLKRASAYEWMEAAGVVLNIEAHAVAYAVVIEPPVRIQHARELARLPADEQAQALIEARELAATNGRHETTYDVKRVVTRRLGEPTPRSAAETDHAREQRAIADHVRRMWARLDTDTQLALLREFAFTQEIHE